MKMLSKKYEVQTEIVAGYFRTKVFYAAKESGDPALILAEKEKLRKMPFCAEKVLMFKELTLGNEEDCKKEKERLEMTITDKDLGIPHDSEKFRDVRARAKDEEFIRKTRKDSKQIQPPYKIDDEIVLTNTGMGRARHYVLIKIVDFDESRGSTNDFEYFGIVLKLTDPKLEHRLGRLLIFSTRKWIIGWNYSPANVKNENIKWHAQLTKEEPIIASFPALIQYIDNQETCIISSFDEIINNRNFKVLKLNYKQ
jgi:esterase/lipase superfamily enzyme